MGRTPQTGCINGHLWTPQNTYVWKDRRGYNQRSCRVCRRRQDQEKYWRDKFNRIEEGTK